MSRYSFRVFLIPAIILCCGVLVAHFSAVFAEKAASFREIRVGVVLPLSGENGSEGQEARRGIELALQTRQEALSRDGLKVRLVYADDRSEPERGVRAVQTLITEHRVAAIIGPFTSPVLLAAAPLAKEHKVVLISGSATHPGIREAGEYVFSTATPDDKQGKVLARFAYEFLRARRAALIYLDNEYGRGLRPAVEREFTRLGGEVALVKAIRAEETQHEDFLVRLKNSRVHCVFLLSYPAEGGLLLKQARNLGIVAPFLGGDGLFSQDLIAVAGETAKDTYVTAMSWRLSSPNPLSKKFVKSFLKQYGVEPTLYSANYFDTTNVVLESLRAVTETGADLESYLKQAEFEGVTGKIHFDNERVVNKPVDIFKVEDFAFDYFQTLVVN